MRKESYFDWQGKLFKVVCEDGKPVYCYDEENNLVDILKPENYELMLLCDEICKNLRNIKLWDEF